MRKETMSQVCQGDLPGRSFQKSQQLLSVSHGNGRGGREKVGLRESTLPAFPEQQGDWGLPLGQHFPG